MSDTTVTDTATPNPVFQSITALVIARALTMAARFGVFEALRDSARTANDVAESLDLDPGTLELILRVLVGEGYLSYDDGRFGLTEHARDTLLRDSANSMAASVGLGAPTWDQLNALGHVLKTGEGVDMHHALTDDADWADYQQAMIEAARLSASLVAEATPVRPGAERLLDIAGSHGLFGAMICRAHPPMKSVVLDLPKAVKQARGIAAAEGIDDVVEFREGDLLVEEFPGQQDVVVLGNILHHFDEAHVEQIIGRVKDVLVPGGTIAILENLSPEPGSPPDRFADTSALLFRVTSSGSIYRASEYVAWLERLGFEDRQVLAHSFGQALITGRVPTS